MKKLLTVCLLVFGAAAFANTGDNVEPAATEKNATVTTVAKKTTIKAPVAQEVKSKPVAPSRSVCTTCSNDARLNVSGYFAEFVNRNNLKLVKLLLD
jgi:hypothetical protein